MMLSFPSWILVYIVAQIKNKIPNDFMQELDWMWRYKDRSFNFDQFDLKKSDLSEMNFSNYLTYVHLKCMTT